MLNNTLLTGKLVKLTSIDPETMSPLWVKWFGNSEFARMLDTDPARRNSTKGTKEWIEKHLDDWLANEFVIRTVEDDRPIGFIGLDGEYAPHGESFVGLGIGEPEYWGKGYGSEAMQLILAYGFMELNLHRVALSVFEYNPRAKRSYEKVGFKEEGRMRKWLFREGKRWDMIFMAVLREDWLKENAPQLKG